MSPCCLRTKVRTRQLLSAVEGSILSTPKGAVVEMYEGPDRIEFSPRLGRPIRMGSWEQLSVSDRQRVLEALQQRNEERFAAYWSYLHFGMQLMAGMALEWGRAWQQEGGGEGHLQALQALQQPSLDDKPLELPPAELALELVRQGDWSAARQAVLDTWTTARAWHDFWFRYSWAVMSGLLERRGQAEVELVIERVLTNSSFYEPSWQQAAGLSQEELAVVLAEHLRLHFSGQEGEVAISDEGDRLRLHLEPCGSGGRMRLLSQDQEAFRLMPQASPLTWGRRDEVPAYCAHCALNELESRRRLGVVRWTTDFQPDPQRPCGWVLPKRLEGAQ